ncbi:MAG: M81 family metallopeptidase [Planctomycetota bacterium]|nr:M81 family metallopeptidase [Planctomycetota bacterium]
MSQRSSRRLRVGIVALLQESNTFLHERTHLEQFQEDLLVTGDEVRNRLETAHHEVGGFFEGLAEHDMEAVPIFAARAFPYGVIAANAFDELLSMMLDSCSRAGSLDGLLVAPHGATVSEKYPDADGHWLSLLRQRFGSDFPIVGTLDPHANVSQAMVDSCNALIAYRTNPHVDQRLRGRQAAGILASTLRNEIQPVMAAAFPPMAIGIERQHTGEFPCVELLRLADEMLLHPSVVANSLILGFPYADVKEMGSSTLVVCDGDRQLAVNLANDLAATMWSYRAQLVGSFLSISSAVDQAAALKGRVCLLDMGDNVGGGSPADATHLAEELFRRDIPRVFVCLYDPEVVQQARDAGIGQTICAAIGGKTDDRHGRPLAGEYQIVSLHDGRFSEPFARHGGITSFDQGSTAILRTTAGMTIMVTSRRMVPFSLQQIVSCGLDPLEFQILVAKGVNAPIAAYEAVCQHFIRVDTPGVTCADMTRLSFQKRRRPMFPFEQDATFSTS